MEMETLVDAMNRLRADGYTAEFRATDDGQLRCDLCDSTHSSDEVSVDETVRFEGESNPSDEAILVALSCECGIKGMFTAAFGPNVTQAESRILRDLAGF